MQRLAQSTAFTARALMAVCMLGLMATATMSSSNIDWEKAFRLQKQLQSAMAREDADDFRSVVRDLVKMTSDSSAYVLGYNVNENSLMAGHLTYWDGNVYQAHLNPFAANFAADGYAVSRRASSLKGKIAFAYGDFDGSSGKYTNSFYRRQLKTYDDAVKLYKFDTTSSYIWGKNTRENCENARATQKEINEVLSSTGDGMLILPSSLYCPSVIGELGDWSIAMFGVTYTENGEPLRYIKYITISDNPAVEIEKAERELNNECSGASCSKN